MTKLPTAAENRTVALLVAALIVAGVAAASFSAWLQREQRSRVELSRNRIAEFERKSEAAWSTRNERWNTHLAATRGLLFSDTTAGTVALEDGESGIAVDWPRSEIPFEPRLAPLVSVAQECVAARALAIQWRVEFDRVRSIFNDQVAIDRVRAGIRRDRDQVIECDGSRLLAAVRKKLDVLDFSKLEAGKLTIEQIEFDPVCCAEDALELYANIAASKRLDMVLDIDPNVPRLIGDPNRLRQIVLNLVSNAVKFTTRGEVAVRLEHEEVDSETVRVRALVRDTGIGIDTQARARIFQPFVQADGSMSRRFGGSGLGLSISRRLAESMGGSIECVANDDVGTTFIVTFVARIADSGTRTGIESNAYRRALVVAERDTGARGLRSHLAELGIPSETTTPSRAPELIADHDLPRIDLIVLDADGDAAKACANGILPSLRSGRATGARIVCATMDRSNDTAQRLLGAGADRVVHKPLLRTRFSYALDAFDAADAEPTAASAPTPSPGAKKPRILVVEDNLVNQRVATALLKALGVDSDVAENGEVALRKIAENDFDGVFMDCQLPAMDGLSATRELRRRETEGRRLPIIALTANVSTEDRAACIEAGMDDFLGKPLLRDAIRIAVDRWIHATRSLGPARHDVIA